MIILYTSGGAVIKGVKSQIRSSGNNVWITWIGERLDVLEERGLEIPIIKEVDKLREEYFDMLDKSKGRKV